MERLLRLGEGRVQVQRVDSGLFERNGIAEDGADVWANLSPEAVADRAEQIRLRLREANDRELYARLLERFVQAIEASGAEVPADEETRMQQLDLVLVRRPQLLRDAFRRLRQHQIRDIDVALPAELQSDHRLRPANKGLYGVFPPGMNHDELAIAEDPMARDLPIEDGMSAYPSGAPAARGNRRGKKPSQAANARFGPKGEPLAPRGEASSGPVESSGPSSLNRVNPVFGPGGEPIASRLTAERDEATPKKGRDRSAAISPNEGEMPGPAEGGGSAARSSDAPSYFAKPSLDDMGPGTDTPTPNRSRGEAGQTGQSYFRKNSLDEMTVGRTEKPKGGPVPQKPAPTSIGDKPAPAASGDDARPVRRERIGRGSYEDAGDEKRKKRRPGKTGRPGR